MTLDSELLQSYAERRSEEAFAELVRRHLNLVYSAAFRQVNGDAYLAQDVTQMVFADLARKAAELSQRRVLTGWLYTSTHFAATKVVRRERRRHSRELEAHVMEQLDRNSGPDLDWDQLRPVLDQVMHELNDSDRDAILMRYFENRPLADIGGRFGLSEDAARKRVERALEKLRAFLIKRGIRTSAALTTLLSANAVQIAPAGLASMLTSASVAIAATGKGTLSFVKLMTMTKLQGVSVAALVVASVVTPWVLERQDMARLRAQNLSLRGEIGQLQSDNESLSNRIVQANNTPSLRLPAPRIQSASSESQTPTEDLQSTNLYSRVKDKSPKLTAEQAEAYLRANRRSAASLLAAFRTTRDSALLEEAMQKYPNDLQVAFEAAFKADASSEQRRQWLDALKRSAPDNSLANYLSALEYFKAGQSDQAVQEIIAASGKPQFQDYTLDRIQDDEEAYLSAGYSVAEAKTVSSMQLLLPQLIQMKQLGLDMVDLANSYRQTGDESSAQAALQMAANLGQRYGITSAGEPEVSQLVGLALERIALGKMDPNSAYGSTGQTVQERMDQIAQQNLALKQLNQQLEPLLPNLSDQDWINYKDRWRAFGEQAAMQWVIGKYGQH